MAWLTPKTDWAPEDGVMAGDFNRIEGNIQELKNTAAPYLRANVTYYVAPTGNDNNIGLSSSEPLATIQAAIGKIPKNLNGYNANIVLAAGTYSGFTMSDIFGGVVTVSSSNNGAIVISSGGISITDCQNVNIRDMASLSVTGQFRVDNCSEISCTVPTTVANATNDAVSIAFSNVQFNSGLTMTAANSAAALLSKSGAKIFAETITINSPSGIGLSVDVGANIAYGSITNNATTKVMTRRGGRIYAGAQVSVPSY